MTTNANERKLGQKCFETYNSINFTEKVCSFCGIKHDDLEERIMYLLNIRGFIMKT